MFAKFKQLAGQSSLYTIGEVLRSSLSFLLLPIYTRLLSPADYAILGVMSPIFALLSALMALGLPAALVRFYFDYQRCWDRPSSVGSCPTRRSIPSC